MQVLLSSHFLSVLISYKSARVEYIVNLFIIQLKKEYSYSRQILLLFFCCPLTRDV